MDNQISSDLIRGHIDTIILHALKDADLFPQQISDVIETKSDKKYKINQATLYSSLKRLESLKLLTSYWHDFEDGRRKYYEITQKGKDVLNKNLSSWEYSRTVIDKLMDYNAPKIIQIIEKPVPISVQKFDEKSLNIEEKSETSPQNKENPSEEQDVNFRNILNGLIKYSESTVKQPEPPVLTELKPLSENIKPENAEVMSFSETLSQTEYKASKINYNGKIDFGDLIIKAEKEGYKINVSSKDSARNEGTLLINKLNLASLFYTFLITLLEFFVLSVAVFNVFSDTVITILCTISILPVLFGLIVYFINKNKVITNRILPDIITTSLIVCFNFILLTLVLNFIFGTDFYNPAQVVTYFVIPILYIINIFIFCVIKYNLSKLNSMQQNSSK